MPNRNNLLFNETIAATEVINRPNVYNLKPEILSSIYRMKVNFPTSSPHKKMAAWFRGLYEVI